jgi:hypothetical protein
MSKISFVVLAVSVLVSSVSADWSIVRYYTSGGCSGDPLWVSVINDASSCSVQECVSSTINSVQTCCSTTEPNPGSDFVSYKVHTNTDTCNGGDITSELWFKLNSCLGYQNSFVKYTRFNATHVLTQTDCDDSSCTTGCSNSFFELGCNGVSFGSTGSGGAISWEFSISDSASSINCNTGTNNVGGNGNGAGSIAPMFALLAAMAAIALWVM